MIKTFSNIPFFKILDSYKEFKFIIWCILVVGCLVVLAIILNGQKNKNEWIAVQATVTKVTQVHQTYAHGERDVFIADVTFFIGNVKHEGVVPISPERMGRELREGEKIEIHYNPQTPQKLIFLED